MTSGGEVDDMTCDNARTHTTQPEGSCARPPAPDTPPCSPSLQLMLQLSRLIARSARRPLSGDRTGQSTRLYSNMDMVVCTVQTEVRSHDKSQPPPAVALVDTPELGARLVRNQSPWLGTENVIGG